MSWAGNASQTFKESIRMPTVIVVLIVALAATLPIPAFSAGKTPENTTVQRVTLAQIFVTNDVGANMRSIRKAFAQAKKDHASWVLFPEGALSGYTNDFDQREVAKGFEEVQQLCKDTGISTLLGICWKEGDKTLNEIRIVDATGALVGEYAKTCLTYSDAEQFEIGRASCRERV